MYALTDRISRTPSFFYSQISQSNQINYGFPLKFEKNVFFLKYLKYSK